MLLDTYSIVENLVESGFEKKQAEAIAKLKLLDYEELATKKDLKIVEKSILSELNVLKWMVGLVCALTIMMISILLAKV